MKTAINFFSLTICILLTGFQSVAQTEIAGTVYDSTKLYVVPHVDVYSTSGGRAVTDSLGNYRIKVSAGDSINFYYLNKYSVKFPVSKIENYTAFDISLKVRVKEKYKLLQGVTVYSNSYKRDSLENRLAYSKIFEREKPTIRSNYELGGPAGLDVNELIGIFQFRKNKQALAFQKRLVQDEEDRFVDYKFSSKTITRITGLKSELLDQYKKIYRPTYFFVSTSTLAQFYEYILNTSYVFKKENGIK